MKHSHRKYMHIPDDDDAGVSKPPWSYCVVCVWAFWPFFVSKKKRPRNHVELNNILHMVQHSISFYNYTDVSSASDFLF